MNRSLLVILFIIIGCTQSSNKELFEKTDAFVQKLQTEYESYGLIGLNESVTTSDGHYTITPIGRLINVKIKESASEKDYEDLKSTLESHYKDNKNVNKVYIAQAGTVMIDCRN